MIMVFSIMIYINITSLWLLLLLCTAFSNKGKYMDSAEIAIK